MFKIPQEWLKPTHLLGPRNCYPVGTQGKAPPSFRLTVGGGDWRPMFITSLHMNQTFTGGYHHFRHASRPNFQRAIFHHQENIYTLLHQKELSNMNHWSHSNPIPIGIFPHSDSPVPRSTSKFQPDPTPSRLEAHGGAPRPDKKTSTRASPWWNFMGMSWGFHGIS